MTNPPILRLARGWFTVALPVSLALWALLIAGGWLAWQLT